MEKIIDKIGEEIHQQLVYVLKEMQKQLAERIKADPTSSRYIILDKTKPWEYHMLGAYAILIGDGRNVVEAELTPSQYVKKYVKTPEKALELVKKLIFISWNF